MNDKVLIEYKGKEYTHLEDFAKDYGVKTSIVKDRYERGHRNPEELLYAGRIPFKFTGSHKIVYKGVEYPSLKQFCKAFKLNYRKALTLWKRNIRDPQKIMDNARFSNNKQVLNDVRTNDILSIERVVNHHGYLTANQVADKTKVDPTKIREQVTRMLDGQNNNMGVEANDIVKINYSKQEIATASTNKSVLPSYAFKPAIIDHINNHLNKINNPNIKRIPFRNTNYYFDTKTNKVFSKQKSSSTFKELKLSVDHYVLRGDDGHRFSFTVDTIKDLLEYPEVTAADLLTKQDVIEKYKMPRTAWNNRRVYTVLPLKIGHTRYDKNGKLVRGWTKETVESVVSKYPKYFAAKKN